MKSTRRQSGVIPYRGADRDTEVLLVTSSRTGRWLFPKGMIERGLSPRESAEREALEEAGAIGTAHEGVISSYTHWRRGVVLCTVDLYAMPVTKLLDESEWQEATSRRRRWASLKKAARLIDDRDILRCLKDFKRWRVAGVSSP